MVAIAGGWNYGDIYDALGAALPAETPALIHGDRAISWGDFAARSNRLARALGAAGLTARSGEHMSVLQSPPVISYAVFCLKAKSTQTSLTIVHVPTTISPVHVL